MTSLLRHYLEASYLYAQETQPLGGWPLLHVLWAVSLSVGALVSWSWARRLRDVGHSSLAARTMTWSCLAGVVALGLRFWTAGVFSARIWSTSATGLALGALLARWIAHLPWPAQARVLAKGLACRLTPADSTLPVSWRVGCVMVHLAGLYVLAGHEGAGVWPAVLSLACLIAAAWAHAHAAGRWGWHCVRPEVLTPLILPYLGALLRWLAIRGLGVDVGVYWAYPYPDIWSPWFDQRTTLVAGTAWMALATGSFLWRCISRRDGGEAWLSRALLLLGIAWYAATVAVHLSAGTTGSDAYCYQQMAIDLAERGTPLHDFPLAAMARDVGVAVWPTVHVGYHSPADGTLAPTVWPIGWPVILVPLYWLAGEGRLRWGAPLSALLSALVTWRLARALSAEEDHGAGWLAGGIGAAILLTSPEATLRSLVPMADAAAQALSVLAIFCLIRARRGDKLAWSALSGGCLALAYFVRHPQLLLALGAAAALLCGQWRARRKVLHLLAFTGGAALCAIPDVWYRTSVFGSPWASESPEWFLISWRNIGPTFIAILRDGWSRRDEFGYLLPFILCGFWQQAARRRERGWAAMMGVSFASVLILHLCYSALRFRDLIALFPWAALWAGRGIAAAWERARTSTRQTSRRILVLGVVLMALASRTARTLGMPWLPRVWTFGYVSAVERSGYTQLAQTLPQDAVVGTSLNSGAVQRYTGHEAVRPAHWTDDEIVRFLDALWREGRALYLLDDGEEMELLLPRVESLGLTHVGEFVLPTFGLGGQDYGGRAVLYRVGGR
jgi:hypothetical protein